MPQRNATTGEIARAIGLKPPTVQQYAREGRIPRDRTPGGHYRYNLDEVEAALAGTQIPDRDKGPHGGKLARALDGLQGRWVAIRGDDVVHASDRFHDMVVWLRRHKPGIDGVLQVPHDTGQSGAAPA